MECVAVPVKNLPGGWEVLADPVVAQAGQEMQVKPSDFLMFSRVDLGTKGGGDDLGSQADPEYGFPGLNES